MRKIHIVIIVAVASILAVLMQTLFGNFLSAKLATLPIFRNLDLFNPRAPIVVNNKETVRVSDANDAVETADSVKSKLSVVVYYDGKGADTKLVRSGGAVNWTADGYFVTTTSALALPNKTYAVILSNGEIYPIKNVFPDKASNLVILSTDARNLSTIEPLAGLELRSGQKLLALLNTIIAGETTFLESYVSAPTSDVSGVVFNSDVVGRTLSVQAVNGFAAGHAFVNLDGKLAGIWNGTAVISSDAIRVFANNFFKNNMQVLRPSFGFSYVQISGAEARGLQLKTGAMVKDVVTGGPAAFAGLLKGDVITTVNGQKIDDTILLESVLSQISPGDVVSFSVVRADQTIPVTVTTKILD